jgi:hypothetical protein
MRVSIVALGVMLLAVPAGAQDIDYPPSPTSVNGAQKSGCA